MCPQVDFVFRKCAGCLFRLVPVCRCGGRSGSNCSVYLLLKQSHRDDKSLVEKV